MDRHFKRLVIEAVVLVGFVLSVAAFTQVMSSLQTKAVISSQGYIIMPPGIGVYSNSACTAKNPSINWTSVVPGSKNNVTVFIRNEGSSPITLSLQTSNWNPSTASTYMGLTWNYGNQVMNPGAVVQVKFTLSVSASITGITSFSFDITITGQ
jgi:hypothetical protein